MVYNTITKLQGESFIIGVDFSPMLDSSEVIILPNSGYTITDIEYPSANGMVANNESVSLDTNEKIILARISGGDIGHKYNALFTANTSYGNTYMHNVLIRVEE